MIDLLISVNTSPTGHEFYVWNDPRPHCGTPYRWAYEEPTEIDDGYSLATEDASMLMFKLLDSLLLSMYPHWSKNNAQKT